MGAVRLNPERVISGETEVTATLGAKYGGFYFNTHLFVPFGRDIGTTDYVVSATLASAGSTVINVKSKQTNGFYVVVGDMAVTSYTTGYAFTVAWIVSLP